MSQRRVIKKPSPVAISNNGIEREATFDHLMQSLLSDPKWGKSLELLELRRETRKKYEALGESWDELVLTKPEHDALKGIAKNPSKPYDPDIMDRAISLIYAITEAETRVE